MGITPHLVLRGTTYYFRMAVPRHLVKKVGRAEVSTSLRTVNRKEATLRCRYLSNSLDVFFQGLCMQKGPTFEEIDAEIKAYFQKALNWSLEYNLVFVDDLDVAEEAEGLPKLIEQYQGQLKSGKFSQTVQSDANELLAPLLPSGGKADLGAIRHACRGIAMAKIEQYRRLIGDLTGEYPALGAGDPRFAGMVATDLPPMDGDDFAGKPETLQSIAEKYLEFKKKKGDDAKTRSDFDISMRLVQAIIPPNRPIHQVTTKDVAAISDLIGTLPPNALKLSMDTGTSLVDLAANNNTGKRLAPRTQEKRLRFFMSMLRWAKKRGMIAQVPGEDIRAMVEPKSASDGEPYTEEALNKIFRSPVYVGRKSAAHSDSYGDMIVRDGKFWVPLIAIHTGMRLGEIVQLRREDVRQQYDVWVFDVNKNEDPNKKVKTESGLRLIPVHRNLKCIGFLDHVRRFEPGERIFPDFKAGKNGFYSHNFSKWWGRYGRKHGFHGEHQVFHSTCHNFTDALRDAEAPEYALKAIIGHKEASVTGIYGKGAKLKILGEIVDRVEIDCDAFRELMERVGNSSEGE